MGAFKIATLGSFPESRNILKFTPSALRALTILASLLSFYLLSYKAYLPDHFGAYQPPRYRPVALNLLLVVSKTLSFTCFING